MSRPISSAPFDPGSDNPAEFQLPASPIAPFGGRRPDHLATAMKATDNAELRATIEAEIRARLANEAAELEFQDQKTRDTVDARRGARDIIRATGLEAVQEARRIDDRAVAPWTAHDAGTAFAVIDLLLMVGGQGDGVRPIAVQARRATGSDRKIAASVEEGIAASAASSDE